MHTDILDILLDSFNNTEYIKYSASDTCWPKAQVILEIMYILKTRQNKEDLETLDYIYNTISTEKLMSILLANTNCWNISEKAVDVITSEEFVEKMPIRIKEEFISFYSEKITLEQVEILLKGEQSARLLSGINNNLLLSLDISLIDPEALSANISQSMILLKYKPTEFFIEFGEDFKFSTDKSENYRGENTEEGVFNELLESYFRDSKKNENNYWNSDLDEVSLKRNIKNFSSITNLYFEGSKNILVSTKILMMKLLKRGAVLDLLNYFDDIFDIVSVFITDNYDIKNAVDEYIFNNFYENRSFLADMIKFYSKYLPKEAILRMNYLLVKGNASSDIPFVDTIDPKISLVDIYNYIDDSKFVLANKH